MNKLFYFLRRTAKVFIGIFYALTRMNLIHLIRRYNKNSENVIWVYFFGYQYPIECLIRDLICIRYLVENGKDYKISFGRKIGRVANSNVFINPSRMHDTYGLKNHCSVIGHVIGELEKQGNKCYPSYSDILFWENKEHMHKKFKELEISCPKTEILYHEDDLENLEMRYPFLLKDTNAHHSKGLYKVNNLEEAKLRFAKSKLEKPGIIFLAQELIEMRKDLRVIHVGGKIVLHYWRVNPEKEWKPTSTSYGSEVDFVTFPEKWRGYIQDQFDKLGMVTGAWDITWNNDDLETQPLFLEISPLYAANPNFSVKGKVYNYGQWKEKMLFKNAYEYKYYEITYEITKLKMDIFFNIK
jgi:glutathione synthase/RimK-type ligase-like ATP-grasp enzyme